MADRHRVTDTSTMHRYRIELPILIDDLDLSVYEFRLYVRFKRRAGDGGSCYEGTRSLAEACGMSMGQVSKAKKSLEQKGLISIGTKQTRGGQTDDVSVIDLWPRNFKAYADEESVHQVNTSVKAFTTQTLSTESVHTVNTLTSKRSPGERKNQDQYHRENQTHDGDGDVRTFAFLIDQGIGAAPEFAHLPFESTKHDYENRRADHQTNAIIVKAWRNNPPTETYYYGKPSRPVQPNIQPDRSRRSAAKGTHNGTGGADLKDPGWQQREIERIQKLYNIPDSDL